MTYDEALSTPLGTRLRTRTGDEGCVIDRYDTGLSVIFTLWRPYTDTPTTGATLATHSANCWEMKGRG